MSNRISEIAKILDKKPSVVLSMLRQLGIDAPNMNTVISDNDKDKLYIKMGKKIKKRTPIVHKVVKDEEQEEVKKTVVVKKRVTVVSKKQFEEHEKNKTATPKKKKIVTTSTKKVKVEQKKVVKEEKAIPIEKKEVENKVKVKKPIEKAIKVEKKVVKEENTKVAEKKPEKQAVRYVTIDKDEINKHRREFHKKPFNSSNNRPYTSNNYKGRTNNNTTNSNYNNRSNGTFNNNRTGGTFNNNRTGGTFNNNRTGGTFNNNRTGGTFNNNRTGGTFNNNRPNNSSNNRFATKSKPADDNKVKIKAPKSKKGDHKKDFDKAFNKNIVRKQTTKNSNSKSSKYKTQTFIPTGKRGVNEALSDEFYNDYYSTDNLRKRRKKNKSHQPKREILSTVKLPDEMTVKYFAEIIKKQVGDVITKLMALDVIASINDEIDFDTASLVADEYNIEAVLDKILTEEDILFDDSEDDEKNLEKRPPIVVVMGHVDHGKTSLLDTIKKTNVADNEAGNITQHIGAYMVNIGDRKITFLDTPGHEAFTAMRKRGAQATDIAIIVVAADDGIMPQTIEAINHAKAANVAIIIAINKIDVKGADVEKVKQSLTEHGIVPEEWGGDVVCVPVSAKTGENIEGLLEMINLTADMLELKVDPTKQAKGTVIESRVDKSGVIATLLVQRGTLKIGDVVISGTSIGKIRAIKDDQGTTIKSAGPSIPIEVLGFDDAPESGNIFYEVKDLKAAKSLVEKRKYEEFQNRNKKKSMSLEDIFDQIKEGKIKDLNIIVKGDVKGSVEAVTDALMKISNEEVQVKVIHGAVGSVSESDISLAEISKAIIIGFNIRPNAVIVELAKKAQVDIRLYRIIYKAIEDIETAIKGMLSPKYQEVVTGHAQVRETFKVSGIGTIAGCMVTDGKIERNSDIRVLRDEIIIYEGKLSSLKRFKDDAKEVGSGYECGMSVEKFNDIKEADVIETYKMEEIVN